MSIQIDCNFPGGNIVVEQIKEDTVYLHQDMRDSKGFWFYWYFRVRDAAGRNLKFVFTRGDVIGVHGPAVSLNNGKTWSWLGKNRVKDASCRYQFSQNEKERDASFCYEFPRNVRDVRFSFAMPYLENNLHSFLHPYRNHPNLKIETLCKTRENCSVERLHLGKLDGKCIHRILLTCRHHCCEMMASYSMEGIMETVFSESDDGRWFQRYVEILVIPFVDKDGVEDGD